MPMRPIPPVFALVLALAGCSGSEQKESRAAIESRLGNIEELEGSISDEMIATEASTIEAPTDGSSAIPGEEGNKANGGEKADDTAAAEAERTSEVLAKNPASSADDAQPVAPAARSEDTANSQ